MPAAGCRVVQYRQYPFPKGINLVDRDQFWRNRYDRVPPPPGHPDQVRGADVITIHEDRDQDGIYEHVKTFADGLSLATSCVSGDRGVWVLQPPYLLFYPDANRDDIPDGPPEVHLTGFGIEDSHAVANSLCWGPDGWLYGSQGSTVSMNVEVTGQPGRTVMQGQGIWRYQPTRHTFEIFAEGGGNIWSCEFDSAGRLFAGSNDANVGSYYLQGGYYPKNFGKHGGVSNPYAYHYLSGIPHTQYRRVTANVMRYEGGKLGSAAENFLFWANPVTPGIGAYALTPNGLTYTATAAGVVDLKADAWLRPVIVDFGPDGALYVCDWYDQQTNHYRNSEGQISRGDGRIFRLSTPDTPPVGRFDLTVMPTVELLPFLKNPNRWWRETALRELSFRPDRGEVVPQLRAMFADHDGLVALEALWALNLCDALTPELFEQAARHPNPDVRRWAVRLVGDRHAATASEQRALEQLASSETNTEVLSQLASSARRLPASQTAGLIRAALRNPHFGSFPELALQAWWAIEPQSVTHPADFISALAETNIPQNHAAWTTLAGYFIRRLASENSEAALVQCAALFQVALRAGLSCENLWANFEQAFVGRPMSALPIEMRQVMSAASAPPIFIRLRLGTPGAWPEALAALAVKGTSTATKIRIIEYLGENPLPDGLEPLLRCLDLTDEPVVVAALGALQAYPDLAVGSAVITRYEKFSRRAREGATVLLMSRDTWTRPWLQALKEGRLDKASVPESFVAVLRESIDQKQRELAATLWPAPTAAISPDPEFEIKRIGSLLRGAEHGDRWAGRLIYQNRCAPCHILHHEGGLIGPNLSTYQRDDINSLLLAIVSPSAEIREGFEQVVVHTRDGRTLGGFLKSRNAEVLILQPIGGAALTIRTSEAAEVTSVRTSLMPPGLLRGLDDQALISLFSYLRSPQPLPKSN